jgi:catechol 2,3-dioxygenase-like lactoylglutathione lyase family enzyme
MNHLAIPVTDQERSRRFYETYLGFGAKPARRYDGDVLMLYDAKGFSLALGPADGPVEPPAWMHFGTSLSDAGAVRALRERGLPDSAYHLVLRRGGRGRRVVRGIVGRARAALAR